MTRIEGWLLRKAGNRRAMSVAFHWIDRQEYDAAAQAFDAAAQVLRRQGASDHETAEPIAHEAWCLVKSDRPSDAIPLYEEALELERKARAAPDRIAQLREQLEWARNKVRSAT